MNKSESKYFNTAVRMDEALLSLLEKKEFDYISIKEICAAAGVHRSTFYLHYENMRDLLAEATDLMHSRFMAYFKAGSESILGKLDSCDRDELIFITPKYLKPYLEYVRDNRRLYGAAMRNPSDFNTDGIYKKMFRDIFNPVLARFSVREEERPFIISFYINGIAAVVNVWLNEDCKTDIDKITKLIIGCINR